MATSRRVGNYATSAKAVVNSSDQIFNAAMSGRPDFTAISKEAIKGRSLERRTAAEAEGQVAKAGINALNKVKQTRIKVDTAKEVADIKRPAQRMAGVVAGLGTLSGAMVLKKENDIAKRERAEDKAATAAHYARVEEINKGDREADAAWREQMTEGLNNLSNSGNSPDPDPAPAVATAPTAPTTQSYKLDGNRKVVLDAIAGPESGSWGYEAFNQGGEKGGTAIPKGFKSGSYQEHFGGSLTNKTLGEIMELQRDPGKGVMSDADWVSSGKLHAVGRYQFIGSTLKDEVTRMGLSLDTKFTPQVQDQIALSHLKRVGNLSPWVGPSQQYSSQRISELESLIPSL